MRLVAWNANYNNRRRSLQESAALLSSMDADVLVLSEVGPPLGTEGLCLGDAPPHLAIIVRQGVVLTPHPLNATAPSLSAAFHVSGAVDFDLLAAWPVQRSGGPSYHATLMATLEHFSDLFAAGPVILAGDLNSSTGVVAQRRTHPVFVDAAESLGLVSAYHAQTGEAHGQESLHTFQQGQRTFHLDYCFLSRSISPVASLRILSGQEWTTRSDHYPVVLDVKDEAFGESPL